MSNYSDEKNEINSVEQLEYNLYQYYDQNYRSRQRNILSINKIKLMKKIYKHHGRKKKIQHAALGTFIAAALLGVAILSTSFFTQTADIDKKIIITD